MLYKFGYSLVCYQNLLDGLVQEGKWCLAILIIPVENSFFVCVVVLKSSTTNILGECYCKPNR